MFGGDQRKSSESEQRCHTLHMYYATNAMSSLEVGDLSFVGHRKR